MKKIDSYDVVEIIVLLILVVANWPLAILCAAIYLIFGFAKNPKGPIARIRQRLERKRQVRDICDRCDLPPKTLSEQEALSLTNRDIKAIAWLSCIKGQNSASKVAHVLADPNTRELQPGLADDLYRQMEETEAIFRGMLLFILKHRVREEGWRTVVKFCRVRTMEEVEDFLMLTNDDYVDILSDFSKYGRIAAEATAAKRVLAHKGIFLDP